VSRLPESQSVLQSIREHFAYLFDGNRFVPVVVEGKGAGEQCLVVLTSDQCKKIKFYLESGVPECYFGLQDAPSGWEIAETSGWYFVDSIVKFLTRLRPEKAVPWPKRKGPARPTTSSRAMLPGCGRI
jgi:hypothetical protein